MNMLNKNARNNNMTIKSLQFLGRKQAQGCILSGWGESGSLQNWLGGGGGGTTYIYMYKQHSIVNTGNFNAEFKLLTHNRYLVLNRHFVRQIHPSSLCNQLPQAQLSNISTFCQWCVWLTLICEDESYIGIISKEF